MVGRSDDFPRVRGYHVRSRVFDPKLMHWLQPDPLGAVDGPNIYAYCGWDPFNKIDPYGLDGYWLTSPLRGTMVGSWLDDGIDGAREMVDIVDGTANQSDIDHASAVGNAVDRQRRIVNEAARDGRADPRQSGKFVRYLLSTQTPAVNSIADVRRDEGRQIVTGLVASAAGVLTFGAGAAYAGAGMTAMQAVGIGAFSGLVGDVTAQSSLLIGGYQDSYDLTQTMISAAMGGVTGAFSHTMASWVRYYVGRTTSSYAASRQVLRGTNKRGEVTSRASFRKGTIQNAWDNAANGPTGGRLCPTCGNEVNVRPGTGPRDWDIDHQPPWTKREFDPGITRPQVLDNYQEGTCLECPSCNRGRGNR